MCWTCLSRAGTAAGPGAEVWHEVCRWLLHVLGRFQQLGCKTCCNIPNSNGTSRAPGFQSQAQRGLCLPRCSRVRWGPSARPAIVPNCPSRCWGLASGCVKPQRYLHFQQWVKVFLYIYCKMFRACKQHTHIYIYIQGIFIARKEKLLN